MWKPAAAAARVIVYAPEHEPSWLPVAAQAAAGAAQPETHMLLLQVLPPVQSLVDRHSTQREVAPSSRHSGVAPPHGVQPAPHDAAVLHSWQAPPAHWLYAPHDVAVHAHEPPVHVGVVPAHVWHDGPQC